MIGARLRQARLAAGLSLEDLAAKLVRPLSKQALSKYEVNKASPSTSTVMDLAQALDVKPSFFFDEPKLEVEWVAFRKHASLSVRQRDVITATAEKRLEGEVSLRELFSVGLNHTLPKGLPVSNVQDVEAAAAEVRERWGLGNLPINGVIETIEDHGGIVLSWNDVREFSGLSGWTNDSYPVIVINAVGSMDRRRFDAAHELGHLVMAPQASDDQYEPFAHRFAGAFLVPGSAVFRELGNHRRTVSIQELGLLKQRWGLSLQAWIRRARDLGIIEQSQYRNLNIEVRSKGWYRQEPYAYEGREEPMLLRRLVSRAVNERMMSSRDAEQLCPGYERIPQEFSLRELARLPRDARYEALSGAPWSVESSETDDWDAIAGEDQPDDL